MHIAVGVKQVYDVDQIKIDPRTLEPVYDVPLKLDDLSRNALEEAIRIKEITGGKITVIILNGVKIGEAVKEALAMGGDEAKIILSEGGFLDTAITASAIAEVIKSLKDVDLVIFGHASVDTYTGQTGPRVAEILGVPVVTQVRELRVNDGALTAIRDLEDSLEEVEIKLPCVITVTNEINEPRLPSLSQILGARKKPVEELELSDLGIDLERGIEILHNRAPRVERLKRIYRDDTDIAAREIISELKKEGII